MEREDGVWSVWFKLGGTGKRPATERSGRSSERVEGSTLRRVSGSTSHDFDMTVVISVRN